MRNPWLDIPLGDYEGHMALPQVAQAPLLSEVFAGLLAAYAPRSVAVLGCAGGNGLERVSPAVTPRVVGVDINPRYVEATRARFAGRIPRLELIAGDVQSDQVGFAPVELLLAGLLFEYVDPERVLARVPTLLCPGGILASVLQLPSAGAPAVTPSPFVSLGALSATMRLIAPERLGHLAQVHGCRAIDAYTLSSPVGKQFRVQVFRHEGVA